MDSFYLPENPSYTIYHSMADSLRFTVERTLAQHNGHLCSKGSFVDPEGEVMDWHDFGPLEGPGWAANAVGGAYELLLYARFTGDARIRRIALSILDHVLQDGFIDQDTGLIRGYRVIPENRFCHNYLHRDDWLCPGSMAKIGYQLLVASDLADPPRADAMRRAALGCAHWIDSDVGDAPNGWYPRRCTPRGEPYEGGATGGTDPLFATSGDGLFALQLLAEVSARGLDDYKERAARKANLFVESGGFFGSINHDTYDAQENVAYSVAFRVLRRVAALLGDERIRRFAFETALSGLERFKMRSDRHGVATKGLLYMEDSWNTAYLWENAEAALACFEAFGETGDRENALAGLTILRAAAKHHHGPHGFLSEGVDWDNVVGAQHHIDGAEYGAIRYTEPFLNNQHITEPTLYYLENLARREPVEQGTRFVDYEGNELVVLHG